MTAVRDTHCIVLLENVALRFAWLASQVERVRAHES